VSSALKVKIDGDNVSKGTVSVSGVEGSPAKNQDLSSPKKKATFAMDNSFIN